MLLSSTIFVLYHNVSCLPADQKFSEIITMVLFNLFMYNYSENNLNAIEKKCNWPE